jgi:hypothetical protein
MLAFLLDVAELPEVFSVISITNTPFQSHTGVAMANAFQDMLERFGLTEKILAVNADNATSNDTQTTKLDALDNSFDETNRVRCFNHTLQLSAKALLKPFNTALSGKTTGDDGDSDDVTAQDIDDNHLIPEDDEEDVEGEDEEEVEGEGEVEDDVDELEVLSEDERNQMLEETTAVCKTVTKVCIH